MEKNVFHSAHAYKNVHMLKAILGTQVVFFKDLKEKWLQCTQKVAWIVHRKNDSLGFHHISFQTLKVQTLTDNVQKLRINWEKRLIHMTIEYFV